MNEPEQKINEDNRPLGRFSIYTGLLLLTWLGLAVFFIHSFMVRERDKNVASVDFDPEQMPEIVNVFDDHFYPKIPDKIIEQAPAWNYANDNPPISLRKALQIAETFRQERLYKIFDFDYDWYLSSILLAPVDAAEAKWCWCFRFDDKPSGYAEIGPTVTFYVLMDGTVLEPLIFDGRLDSFERIQREWKKRVLAESD